MATPWQTYLYKLVIILMHRSSEDPSVCERFSNQLCSMTYKLQTYPFVANQYGHAHLSVLDIQVRNVVDDSNIVDMAVI
ncbi:hypothetical protein CY34DRAFT_807562 [Suillus luteus UH-Slu-Lm8-n1]|uniref:Uncharacterized protein n=1 Tax=Suillus luteus UH-Slu-Lm8-n1 TaxID=930992 RepID=A0A0D0AEG2_9AGAM|nr:hypothetical protein CY34DRAFT_807562 [Suillus luteus UH-Slu-Lm8-n1]